MRLPAYTKIAGFTLVESLVALAILGMFFAALTAIFHVIITNVGQSRVRTVATALAQERLELIRNLSYNDVGTIGGIPTGTLTASEEVLINGAPFTVETSVVYTDDPFDGTAPSDAINTDYKTARVAVSWGGAFPSQQPLILMTHITPKGLESTVGGGTLSILVFDATPQAVTEALVTIDNTSVTPEIHITTTTDAQGRVYLPGAPVCTECYQVSVTKNGFSTDRTYSSQEVANPAKPHANVNEGEITELSFTIDPIATLTVATTGSRESNYPPLSGVQFILTGTKTIGTTVDGDSVYKYQQTHATSFGGLITIADLEPDTYTITLPGNSSVDIAGMTPFSPFVVAAGSSPTVKVVTNAASSSNLLTLVTDSSNTPLATASVLLSQASFEASKSTGLTDKGDFGQAFFSNLTNQLYDLRVALPSFQEATASVQINGDTIEKVILTPNP